MYNQVSADNKIRSTLINGQLRANVCVCASMFVVTFTSEYIESCEGRDKSPSCLCPVCVVVVVVVVVSREDFVFDDDDVDEVLPPNNVYMLV